MANRVYVDGKVHVRRTMCDSCIFRPADKGRLVGITDERVAEMVTDADAAESCIPCHHHLHTGSDIEPVCRGYFNRRSSTVLRIADALGAIEYHDG